MKLVLNSKILDNDQQVPLNNRGLQFGDGVFETIIYVNGEIRFYDDHYDRLSSGMIAIGLTINQFTKKELGHQIKTICETNNLPIARVKVMVWRKSSSLPGYQTNTSQIEFAIIPAPTTGPQVKIIESAHLSTNTTLNYSMTSPFKTLSSLVYVQAHLERNKREVDELIITDHAGWVSECCSSNLFWISDDKIYTPPLSTGCIKGIMRRQVMKNFNVIEKQMSYNHLLEKETLFSTNIAQLSIFNRIGNNSLKTNHSLLEEIKQLWEL